LASYLGEIINFEMITPEIKKATVTPIIIFRCFFMINKAF
jgi:hypothetical protein